MASAAPIITLSNKSGPPTSKILVSGRGFEPNVGVDIFFDTKDKALVVTNGRGEFHDATIHAPRSARPGDHWVGALERNNDKGAQEPFLVQTDWRQFHFDADGTRLNPYENVLNLKTVANLDLRWSYTSGGPVANLISPAVANGVLYIGSSDFNVYALKADTGKKLWSRVTQGLVYSSPAVADGVVYVGSFDGSLYAFDANTGRTLWTYKTTNYVDSSPTVANGMVYFGSDDGRVYALNASTGAKLWSYDTGDFVDSSPAVANGVLYIGCHNGKVHALGASTGAQRWSYLTGDSVLSSPAVANGVVYVGSWDDNVYALNAVTGERLWSYATGSHVGTSPAVADGRVYVGSFDDNLYAFSVERGHPRPREASHRPELKTLHPDFTLKVDFEPSGNK
jgi:outer membrane protein assembly factor BamB